MGFVQNPIIAALDVPTAEAALALAGQLAPVVGALKIGSELFTSAGPEVVRRIHATGAPVFLDLKLHDIPNTVAKAVAAATRLKAHMLTIHASGGLEMMQAAEAAAQATARQLGCKPPLAAPPNRWSASRGSPSRPACAGWSVPRSKWRRCDGLYQPTLNW
jgi:orotidine-5'-phosphate decarboxylase